MNRSDMWTPRRPERARLVPRSAWVVPLALVVPIAASAHEAYVLTAAAFHAGFETYTPHPFAALVDPAHLPAFLAIAFCVAL